MAFVILLHCHLSTTRNWTIRFECCLNSTEFPTWTKEKKMCARTISKREKLRVGDKLSAKVICHKINENDEKIWNTIWCEMKIQNQQEIFHSVIFWTKPPSAPTNTTAGVFFSVKLLWRDQSTQCIWPVYFVFNLK